MPSRKPWSPWKVLLVAVLASTICFVLFVGGTIYWFVSFKNAHQTRGGRQRNEQRDRVSRQPFPAETGSTNFAENPTNFFQHPRPHITRTNTVARNAIVEREGSNKTQAGDDIFRDLFIPDIEIEIPTEAKLRLTVNPRTYVKVNIREGDLLYTNVALRLKGGPGSYQQLYKMPSFTVNFDTFAPGQTFHGLKKIHLNSSVQDHTWLNEKICRELFEAGGVPVPRAGHAVVTFNSRDPRLYVVLEGVNKQFLKRYFKDGKGNVYDGHSGTDVTDALPLNSGEEDRSRLKDLAAACRERNLETRLRKLEETLDLDRFLSFVALEMMCSHWDGYTIGRNNYRIAHDRDTDRMVFIPHGMDQMFGGDRQDLLNPQPAGLVARAVLQIPEARKRYQDRVAELTTNVFRIAAITNRVWEISGKIAQALAEADPGTARGFRQNIPAAYSRKIKERGLYLVRETNPALLPSPTKFDRFAVAPLTNWTSKIDEGEARLTEERDGKGNVLLYIGTTARCTASWRTATVLPPGKYRIEARLKTKGVEFNPADQRDGAGLRISRYRNGQKNDGDHDWFQSTFDFEVQQDGAEKELICELRANQGEVWFDLKSLTLKRL
jgi:hypothetical protein